MRLNVWSKKRDKRGSGDVHQHLPGEDMTNCWTWEMVRANVTGRLSSIPSTLGVALIECLKGVPRRDRTYELPEHEAQLGPLEVRENKGGFPWDPTGFPAMLVDTGYPEQPLLFGPSAEMIRSQRVLEETF
jgi:hypothetical protein